MAVPWVLGEMSQQEIKEAAEREKHARELLNLEIEQWFTYHAPQYNGQVEAYTAIRAKAKELALLIANVTPRCADQTAALRNIREGVMTANAAVALNALFYSHTGAIGEASADGQTA